MVITYKVSEIMDALQKLSDVTPFESQVKIVAQYMLSQHYDDDDCCLFVCPNESPEPVVAARNLLNFIIGYYDLIGCSFYSVQDCLDSAREFKRLFKREKEERECDILQ